MNMCCSFFTLNIALVMFIIHLSIVTVHIFDWLTKDKRIYKLSSMIFMTEVSHEVHCVNPQVLTFLIVGKNSDGVSKMV